MPWIEGPTWFDVLIEKKPLSPDTSLSLARSLAQVLVRMEEQGIAHCDLSSSNLMLPILAGGKGVELVDLEGFYGPGMVKPQALSSGSAGYAHKQAVGGLWGPEADRFAGAVLLAEMLGFCDEEVCQLAWGESYFDPAEMQEETNRFRKLIEVLERRWGGSVAHLFERAWRSDSLLDCPTFGEWLVALPEQVAVKAVSLFVPLRGREEVKTAEAPAGQVLSSSEESAVAVIRGLMQAARRLEEQNNLAGALEVYRQALELAQADPSLRSLAREIELTIQDVEKRARPILPRPVEESLGERAISLPMEEVRVALPAEERTGIGEEPRPGKRPWFWALAGLIVFALLAALVYGVNMQQQAGRATATAQARAAAARAQAGRIAFISDRDGNDEIYVMNADGSGVTRLTNNPAYDGWPAWSPDGRRIAFASNRDGNPEIYVMNADGSGVTRLTNNPADDWAPSWSPDGRRIIFVSNRDGNYEIYVMNSDGSGVTRLTNNPARDVWPAP
jgi:type II secretory pathway pseudopilin PulG